ncbi:MAG TPA: MFS transporter [Gaiellaceae bacterium]|jgi:MFS family permease|nr:MFS transporter [Gaiellaceae bacterium]
MRIRAALGAFALAFTPGFNVANVGAVADQVSHAYGIGLAVVGLFTTGLFLSHAALQVPMGRLCDRFGARIVGGTGLAIVACASAAALGWKEAWFAIAMRFVAGVGTAASFVAGAEYTRATIGSAVAQGMYGAVTMAAGGLALALVPLWGSWRAPFATAAIAAAAGVVVLTLAEREPERQPVRRGLPTVVDRRLLPLAAMHAASFGLAVVIGNWVVTLLHRAGGVSEHVAGLAGALVLFLGVISRPLGGRLMNRPGVVRASFVISGLGIAVLSIAEPLPLAIAAAAVIGIASGIPFAPAFAGAQRLRPDAPAAAVGFVNMGAAVTILVGTPLLGLTFSLPGDGRIGFLVVAVLCSATAAVVRSRV